MSLRGDLFGRGPATTRVPLVLDRAAHQDATREVEAAAAALSTAQARGDWDVEAERRRLADAKTALAAVPVREMLVRALPPHLWDELIEAHPPTPEQQAQGAQWNPRTHRAPVLAASVVPPEGEDPLTADEWEQLGAGGHITDGELNALYEAAILLNVRAPQVSTGKD